MRILVLNQYFRPEAASSAQRLSELVDDLAVDHDVTVVAGRASYDRAPGASPQTPAGRPSPGATGSIRVVRVPSTAFHRRSMSARIFNYVTYLLWACLAGLTGRRPDIVIAATDPPLVGLVGRWISRVRRSSFVHILWDIQPQATLAAGLLGDGVFARALDRLNRQTLAAADAVVVPTRDMQRSAIALGAAPARVAVVPHWEDTDAVRPMPKDNAFSREHGLVDRFVVMYSGNIGLTQRLEICLELAARVRDLDDVVMLIVGEGAGRASLDQIAAARHLSNVRFLPYQPRHRLPELLGAADVCVAPLAAGLTPFMLPSKIYTIMAAGRPLIAAIDTSSEVADVILRHACGHVVPPGDVHAFEDSLRWFHGHPVERAAMGRCAREASERHWSRAVVTPQYLDLVMRVARRGRAS